MQLLVQNTLDTSRMFSLSAMSFDDRSRVDSEFVRAREILEDL
jgi:hypothetical protein